MLRRLGAITAVPGGGHAPLSLTASPMTTAQLRVLDYLPTHLNYTEIAVELFISRNTVKSHAIAIFRKLGVSSRSEAIVVAGRLGLAPHGDFVFLSTAEQSILLDLLNERESMDGNVDISFLETVVCGGSAVPLSLMKGFQDKLGVKVIQAWGMTETSPLAALAAGSPHPSRHLRN